MEDIDTFLLFTNIAVALFFAFTVISVLDTFVFIKAIIFPFSSVFVVFTVMVPLDIVKDPSEYVAVDTLVLSSEFISGAYNVIFVYYAFKNEFLFIYMVCDWFSLLYCIILE